MVPEMRKHSIYHQVDQEGAKTKARTRDARNNGNASV